MRVFALSDIHVDYPVNVQWILNLSLSDYQDDVLIVAGDVTDDLDLFERSMTELARRFRTVLFAPGNHDLWVVRSRHIATSFDKFIEISNAAERGGVSLEAFHCEGLSIIPLLGWYDYSFGLPCERLREIWMDFHACRWPEGYLAADIAGHFDAMNADASPTRGKTVITFSHFLPRMDLLPAGIPESVKMLLPILGTPRLEARIRALEPAIHVYGHSHLNRQIEIDGVTYINNAFGYPRETRIARKQLLCIHDA